MELEIPFSLYELLLVKASEGEVSVEEIVAEAIRYFLKGA